MQELKLYEKRITQNIENQCKILEQISTIQEASNLRENLTINFHEKIQEYQRILQSKVHHIEELEKEEEIGLLKEDIINIWNACDRCLPYRVYQLLSLVKPESRKRLVNLTGIDGIPYGPLHVACLKGNIQVVKVLLAFGADPTSYSDEGLTPLHYCAKGNHSNVIAELMEPVEHTDEALEMLNKTELNCTNKTPLITCAIFGSVEAAQEILHWAYLLGIKRRKLLQQKAIWEGNSGTALEIATYFERREMVLFLFKSGAEPLKSEKVYELMIPDENLYSVCIVNNV